jgi:hypothetical protein
MGLYACIVLTAELAALDEHLDSARFALGAIWGTSVGLTLAHVFAFDLAARAFSEGPVDRDTREAIGLQVAAGTAVAVALTVPFLVLDPTPAADVAGFIAAAFVGITAYGVARGAGRSRFGAVAFGAVTLGIAAIVVSVKVLLTH